MHLGFYYHLCALRRRTFTFALFFSFAMVAIPMVSEHFILDLHTGLACNEGRWILMKYLTKEDAIHNLVMFATAAFNNHSLFMCITVSINDINRLRKFNFNANVV